MVVAPAGYGKSTLIDQWLVDDDRVGARCVLDGREQRSGPTGGAPHRNDHPTAIARRLAVPGGAGRRSHAHVATGAHRRQSLVAQIPPGSTLAIAGRTAPDLLLGMIIVCRGHRHRSSPFGVRRRRDRRPVSLDGTRGRRARRVDPLVDRTEGWPAAPHLAIRGALEADDPHRFLAEFAGDDTYFAELLHDELLDGLPPETTDFLLAASSLERMSGPLCDEALGRTGRRCCSRNWRARRCW